MKEVAGTFAERDIFIVLVKYLAQKGCDCTLCLHVSMQIKQVIIKGRKGDIVNIERKWCSCLSQQIIKDGILVQDFK